jgi:hypothetical protein
MYSTIPASALMKMNKLIAAREARVKSTFIRSRGPVAFRAFRARIESKGIGRLCVVEQPGRLDWEIASSLTNAEIEFLRDIGSVHPLDPRW